MAEFIQVGVKTINCNAISHVHDCQNEVAEHLRRNKVYVSLIGWTEEGSFPLENAAADSFRLQFAQFLARRPIALGDQVTLVREDGTETVSGRFVEMNFQDELARRMPGVDSRRYRVWQALCGLLMCDSRKKGS